MSGVLGSGRPRENSAANEDNGVFFGERAMSMLVVGCSFNNWNSEVGLKSSAKSMDVSGITFSIYGAHARFRSSLLVVGAINKMCENCGTS